MMVQRFMVEDYLLGETYLRVTGENLRNYQPGDSVNLYAFAYNSNGLPVLDGKIDITVRASSYELMGDNKMIFIPDTLYHANVPVNPEGDTYIGFSTKDLPPLKTLYLQCYVSLTNSNFEKKDTTFTIYYNADRAYFQVTENGEKIKVELIGNKKSVAGSGYYTLRDTVKRKITYPFETTIDKLMPYYNFYQTDDTGGIINQYQYTVGADSLQVYDDYLRDTAYLQVVNPKKVWYRYTLYKGNQYLGYGVSQSDTLIKVRSKKSETVTMKINYAWMTNPQDKTFTAFKLNRKMLIDVKKKDIIYPGQTDSIGINLSDVDGNGIPKTNVTVLAFTSKFKEDFTPQLTAAGLIKPGLGDVKYTRGVQQLSPQYNKGGELITPEWAKHIGADSVFFYKNIYFNPLHFAVYGFDIPKSPQPQLAVYIREGSTYIQPEAVYIDNRPVYIKNISVSTDFNAMFVDSGQYVVRVRTRNSLYTISQLHIKGGIKTNLFINADSLDSVNRYVTFPYISRVPMPDSFTNDERNVLSGSIFIYRGERGNEYTISQGNLLFNAAYASYNNNYYERRPYYGDNGQVLTFGPLNMYDSINYFEFRYMKQRFIPEMHFVYTLRPGMMRLERQMTYDLINNKLSGNSLLLDFNRVAEPAPNFDSLVVNPPIVPAPERKPTKAYVIKPNAWETNEAYNARLEIRFLANRYVKVIALRPLNDTLKPYIIANGNYGYGNSIGINAKPGAYDLLILWTDSSSMIKTNIVLRPNGSTILPLLYDSSRFNMEAPPKWFAPYAYIQYDGQETVVRSYDYKGSGEVGAVSGNVKEGSGDAMIGAIVQLLQGGLPKGGMQTDVDGNFKIKNVEPGYYDVQVKVPGYKALVVSNVLVTADKMCYMQIAMQPVTSKLEEVVITAYKVLMIDRFNPGARSTVSSEEVEMMPSRSVTNMAPPNPGVYSNSNGLNIAGARTQGTLYLVDGVQTRSSFNPMRGNTFRSYSDDVSEDEPLSGGGKKGSKKFMQSEKAQQFMAAFLENMQAASGMRKEFRDWAIWQPNLWTDSKGNTSFTVKYPDDVTSWKTYVLAMNTKGFSGSTLRLTRAFKPLSAELSLPRFLRYGDTVEMVGKVMNYSGKPFNLSTTFINQDRKIVSDTMTVNNARVDQLLVAAPATNSTDTVQLPSAYKLTTTETGYTDGEERVIPVLPVGVIEHKGEFITMMRDTSIFSKPTDTAGHFTGKSTICIDGSLLEVMLREIENLKVYPYGCTEQLTSKLLAIYYEEEVKKIMGIDTFNNKKEKKEILDKLVFAQNRNGSFGWFAGNNTDYRVTNYVLSTLTKANKDGWLDYILRRGFEYLNNNLSYMDKTNLIASLSTLSEAKFPASYKLYLDKLKPKELTTYDKFAIVQIKKQQGLAYRPQLDSLIATADKTANGIHWGERSYDWYRNELATTLLAYKLISDDSVYAGKKEDIMKYLLFRRMKGYYGNTAESGLVLTTLLPDIIKNNKPSSNTKRTTEVYIAGSLKDTVSNFPAYFTVQNKTPQFYFQKSGFSPAYVSVIYEYFNMQPKAKTDPFKVNTYFLSTKDTVTSLKQGDRVTLRTQVTCTKEADYVMLEIPIPAGCIQANNNRGYYIESNRENYKDRTVIYCGHMPKGTYTFDVELQARYKGSFNLNPASASMMYYPEEYGNNEVKKVRIK
jgi:hypothetical protein